MNKAHLTRPSYSENAVLQLIVVTGTGYILYNFTYILMVIYGGMKGPAAIAFLQPYLAIGSVQHLSQYWWTPLVFGWAHWGFWMWLSNMIWLYAIGSIFQQISSYKQVIPLFFYGNIAGALVYYLAQIIFPGNSALVSYHLGCEAALMALAFAALLLSPKHRFYIGSHIYVQNWVVVVLFIISQVVLNLNKPFMFALLAGGAVCGMVYAALLKNNYRPGEWIFNIIDRFNEKADNKDKQYDY